MEAITAETFPITITQSAARQISRLRTKKQSENVFLRLGVQGGGCSGFSYLMRFEESVKPTDIATDIDGTKIVVDPKSAKLLSGSTLDYNLSNLLEGGWKWTNPNAGQSCGCGTSFTPK